MKRRVHLFLLGLELLIVIPGAFLAVLMAAGAVLSAVRSGFQTTDFVAILLLMIPVLLSGWGARLFVRLYEGFSDRVRRGLFRFYGAVSLYGGLWLFSTYHRGGHVGFIFGVREQAMGMVCLFVPLVMAMLTPGEAEDAD